jgi:hypothetical protein
MEQQNPETQTLQESTGQTGLRMLMKENSAISGILVLFFRIVPFHVPFLSSRYAISMKQ